MHHLMTAFDGGKHGVPFAFDVGAIGVQCGLETRAPSRTFSQAATYGDKERLAPIGTIQKSTITFMPDNCILAGMAQ